MSYCDYVTGPSTPHKRRNYLTTLRREIGQSRWRRSPATTVFFGGGTPSQLELTEIAPIVQGLRDGFDIDPAAEWTIECNPDTPSDGRFVQLRKLGFNRASLGVQSFHAQSLTTLGRSHGSLQAVEAFQRLREAGFENINLDLMFGVPGQSTCLWERDLRQALELAPEHLSLYSLTVEPDTDFGRRAERGELQVIDEQAAATMYERALSITEAAGFRHYEISHFALPGKECRHNLVYWRNRDYLGFGAGAVSSFRGLRWKNTSSVDRYASGPSTGLPAREYEEQLTPRQALGESIMLGLRTSVGVELSQLSQRHGLAVPSEWVAALETWRRERYLKRTAERFQLTRRGLLVGEALTQALNQNVLSE